MATTNPPVKSAAAPRRTLPIIILAILAVVAGISAVVDTLRLMGWLPTTLTTTLGELEFYNVNWFAAILTGVVALIWFATAGQLWRLDPRGWLFVAVIATINLIFLVLAWFSSSFQAVAVSMAVNVVALILAMLPSTKAAFGMDQPPVAVTKR